MKYHEVSSQDAMRQPLPEHVCPFLAKPFPDCYCMDLSSSNIRKMLAFCIGDYRSCSILSNEQKESCRRNG